MNWMEQHGTDGRGARRGRPGHAGSCSFPPSGAGTNSGKEGMRPSGSAYRSPAKPRVGWESWSGNFQEPAPPSSGISETAAWEYTGNSCDPSIWYTDTRCTAAGHVHLSLNIPCHIPTARCSTAASHHTSHSSTSTPGPRSSGQQGTSLGITCSGMTCTPPEAALAGPVCLPFLCAQLMC
ncbi:uncharacterized protein LOC128105589 isoform X2 [Peromyscus californicus insignis]|uniref:uncharacterized protein LOC128105589 isoform X2 n=1 Tax=Peromyscus californicus insignis TaxID=564181 RepID=UPI0022A77A20|nr:uncharacterized protein LOC128105589 isoform X2 [Peromyscus californicus insignis]